MFIILTALGMLFMVWVATRGTSASVNPKINSDKSLVVAGEHPKTLVELKMPDYFKIFGLYLSYAWMLDFLSVIEENTETKLVLGIIVVIVLIFISGFKEFLIFRIFDPSRKYKTIIAAYIIAIMIFFLTLCLMTIMENGKLVFFLSLIWFVSLLITACIISKRLYGFTKVGTFIIYLFLGASVYLIIYFFDNLILEIFKNHWNKSATFIGKMEINHGNYDSVNIYSYTLYKIISDLLNSIVFTISMAIALMLRNKERRDEYDISKLEEKLSFSNQPNINNNMSAEHQGMLVYSKEREERIQKAHLNENTHTLGSTRGTYQNMGQNQPSVNIGVNQQYNPNVYNGMNQRANQQYNPNVNIKKN